jgi:hypothetical protein
MSQPTTLVPVTKAPYPANVRARISDLIREGHEVLNVIEHDPDTFTIVTSIGTVTTFQVRA